MFKIFCLVLLSSKAFAANYSAQELADFAQEDIESQDKKSVLKPVLIGGDEPMPRKASLIKSTETGDLVAVVLPENTYRIDIYMGDQNSTQVSDDMKTASLEEVELVIEKVIESNGTALMEDPEFKINYKLPEPAMTTPTPPTTPPVINSTTFDNSTNLSANETKPEKSFLEKIEETLGISVGASSCLTLSKSVGAIILVIILLNNSI